MFCDSQPNHIKSAQISTSIHANSFYIENALIQSGQFTLPGKKKLQESDTIIEIILVDATEQAIERPKKTEITL